MTTHDPVSNQLRTLGDGKAREALLERIKDQLVEHGWTEQEIFGMQMAIEESVSNAYRHGNQAGKLGDVEIEWQITAAEFHIKIRDQGVGFDENAVADATDPGNLENLTGRGLLLMRNFMTEVDYEDGGRMVIMKKSKSTAKAE